MKQANNKISHRLDRSVDRAWWAVVWSIVLVVFLGHVLGAVAAPEALWGLALYGFLPTWWLVVAAILLGITVLVVNRQSIGTWLRQLDEWLTTRPTRIRVLLGGGWITISLAFWLAREQHTLLGDGAPLIIDLAKGQRFHPHEPLTYLIHHYFFLLARGLFEPWQSEPVELARSTVALSSVLAGAIFLPVAWLLATELVQLSPPVPDGSRATVRAEALLVCMALLSQGYMQLFFGYVENYSFSLLVIGAYLLTSLRCLRGLLPLFVPGVVLVVLIGLDLSMVVLVPSFFYLLFSSSIRARPWITLVSLGGIAAAVAALASLLRSAQPGYDLGSSVFGLLRLALVGSGGRGSSEGYLISIAHLRDFLNEQFLIGPLGALILSAIVVLVLASRVRIGRQAVFLLLAGLTPLLGSFLTTDLNLGYARDWDLFAAVGLSVTACGLGLSFMYGPAQRAPWLALLTAASLFHTIPWVAVNSSFERSFERFKTLPLGLGRTEASVGNWYLAHGQPEQAMRWFRLSLDENPANSVAAYGLGLVDLDAGQYDLAARAFWEAVKLRPDKEEFRSQLVDALVLSGEPVVAGTQLDTLLEKSPDDAYHWARRGVVALARGDLEHAREAFGRARSLDNSDPVYQRLPTIVDSTRAYEKVLDLLWPRRSR